MPLVEDFSFDVADCLYNRDFSWCLVLNKNDLVAKNSCALEVFFKQTCVSTDASKQENDAKSIIVVIWRTRKTRVGFYHLDG